VVHVGGVARAGSGLNSSRWGGLARGDDRGLGRARVGLLPGDVEQRQMTVRGFDGAYYVFVGVRLESAPVWRGRRGIAASATKWAGAVYCGNRSGHVGERRWGVCYEWSRAKIVARPGANAGEIWFVA
jgi:hypothetical protein